MKILLKFLCLSIILVLLSTNASAETKHEPISDNTSVTIWEDSDDIQISRENQNEYFHNFVDVCTKGFRTEKEMISEVCRAEFTYNATYFLTLEQLEYFRSNKPGIVTIHYSENKYADSLPEELKYNKEPGYFRMFAVLSNDIVVEKAYNVETRNHYTVQEFIKEAVEYGDVVLVVFDMEEYPYAIDGFYITNCSIGWNTVNGEKYYVRKDGTLATKACTINGKLYKFDKSGICKGKYTGWAKNSNGKIYYKNGSKVTKSTTIKGIRYKFSSDGICQGKYSGWTESKSGRRYWSKGILAKNKWLQDSKDNYYYAGNNGYLLTGWQEVTRIGGNYSYFDENGVWDGKKYISNSFDSEDQIVLADDDDELIVEDTISKTIDPYYTDYLKLSDKDVFYSNIENEPSWQGHNWEKSDFLGAIKANSSERNLSALPLFSANKLPVGTKIYKSTYGGIVVLAEVNERLILYQKIVEG